MSAKLHLTINGKKHEVDAKEARRIYDELKACRHVLSELLAEFERYVEMSTGRAPSLNASARAKTAIKKAKGL